MRVRYFLVMMCCLSLLACGGGGSDAGSSGGGSEASGQTNSSGAEQSAGDGNQSSAAQDGFAQLQVADDFNWQMDERTDLSFELVSLVSQGANLSSNSTEQIVTDSGWLSISGRYLVNVFAIDSDGNVLTNAIFTGMTNQYGQLAVNFNLMDEWLGVVVDVDLGEQSCSQSIYKDELTSQVQLGCDLAVGSDL